MNKPNYTHRTLIAVLFTVGLTVSNTYPALITLSPPVSGLSIGETFKIGLSIADLGDEDLGAFTVGLGFDPEILEFVTFMPGVYLGTNEDMVVDAAVTTPGNLDIGLVSMLADLGSQPGSFLLGEISFRGIGYGSSQISFASISLGNGDGSAFIPSIAGPATSASVPEPPIMPMLATSLLGIAFWRRRSRTNNNC